MAVTVSRTFTPHDHQIGSGRAPAHLGAEPRLFTAPYDGPLSGSADGPSGTSGELAAGQPHFTVHTADASHAVRPERPVQVAEPIRSFAAGPGLPALMTRRCLR